MRVGDNEVEVGHQADLVVYLYIITPGDFHIATFSHQAGYQPIPSDMFLFGGSNIAIVRNSVT